MAERKNINTETPPEEIQADIVETRHEISGTVGAIREKLSPGRMKSEAKQRLRESTIGRMKTAASRLSGRAKETGSTILDTVKSDPVPLALLGVGISWFLINRARRAGNGSSIEYHEAPAVSGSEVGGAAEEISGNVRARAQQFASQAKDKASELAGKSREAAERFTQFARERASGASSRIQDMIQEHPLTAVSVALGIGAAIGLALPVTRKEQGMMGSASGSLMQKARHTARETMQKAQHAVERGIETAKQEFK